MNPHTLKVYIDGSAYKNPGHNGGLAGMLVYPDDWNKAPKIIFSIPFDKTTNNRMELRACIFALDYLYKHKNELDVNNIEIFSDSSYVCDNQFNAIKWRKNNWNSSTGIVIANHDLWKDFLSKRTKIKIRVEIKWFKGKSTDIVKIVDRLAKESSDNPLKNKDWGYINGRVTHTKLNTRSAAKAIISTQKELIIRIYRYKLLSAKKNNLYKVDFDLYSENENKYINKHYAYLEEDKRHLIHRNHCYKITILKSFITTITPIESCPDQ